MTKIISITGQEKCDIVFYLSELYRALKKHTLVIDNSYSKDLFEAIRQKNEKNVAERGFVVYSKDMDYSPEAFVNFDVIIFYEGYNPCANNLLHSQAVFIITDYRESSVRQIREAFEKEGLLNRTVLNNNNTTFFYILRDKISKRIRDKVVFSLFCDEEEKGSEYIKLVGAIPFSYSDFYRYIDFSHNKRQNLKGVSDGMKEALVFILEEVEQLNRNVALKIINKA